MDVIEKFLNEVSWKFDKGYPDMGNPKDIELLNELAGLFAEKEQIIKESSEDYDKTIKRALGLKPEEDIPRSNNKYEFKGEGGSTFDIQVKDDDMETFIKLYGVAPPKKGETEGQTKGVGNGEIALYWLYQFSQSGVEVTEGRAGDDPDLWFGGVGVEVKAYSSHNKKIDLGRFGADKENLQLLGVIFGIHTLVKVLGVDVESSKTVNPTNFQGISLIPAFREVINLTNVDLSQLSDIYPVFKTIESNINFVNKTLGNPKSEEEGAKAMAYKMLLSKLGRKPGDGGYLANVLKSGGIRFYGIHLEKVRDSEKLLKNFGVGQSSINLNFSNLFG